MQNGLFLAPRTGHIWSYSCPFDLVPSRIDSAECPLQNRVLGFEYIFFFNPNLPKMTSFCPEKAPKGPKGSKTHRKGPKWCRNDAKMTRKWPQNDPGSTPKMVHNDPQMTLFWSHFWVPKWFKKCQRRPVKRPQKVPKTVNNGRHVQKCPRALEIHLRYHRVTVPPGTHSLHTYRFL